jgi:hypothetical protein
MSCIPSGQALSSASAELWFATFFGDSEDFLAVGAAEAEPAGGGSLAVALGALGAEAIAAGAGAGSALMDD